MTVRLFNQVTRFDEIDWWLLVSSFDPTGSSFDLPTAENLAKKVEEHEEFWMDYREIGFKASSF